MKIACPREIKNHEYRVGLTPQSVRELCVHGHEVLVQVDAGLGMGASNEAYRQAGATLVPDARSLYALADMVVKVKEPQPEEYGLLRSGQILFTFLHLAPDPEQTQALIHSGVVAVAYETITGAGGGLPLLAPMSEVAGRMSVQAGAAHLEKSKGGMGLLLGGVPGVPAARVVVLGAGVVGTHALQMAVGLGARVLVLDKNLERLRQLVQQYGNRIQTLVANSSTVEEAVLEADLVIGAVLVPGASAPRLVTRSMVERMKPGAVVVDVAIDQGGCFETSRPTTHAQPTFEVGGVVHYCVANMPGAVPKTSTLALNNVTLPCALALANQGWRAALRADAHLRAGLNVAFGQVCHPGVAQAQGLACVSPEELL
jgi:alanine dehydrogenase